MLAKVKHSMIVLSCLSGMADKNIANSFLNTSYKNKLSKLIKSIERWVIDVLKREKEN